ncbi:hypothetical protein Tco_0542909 [Tanacetum coccineum]
MDKSYSLSTPMVVRTLDVKKDPFRPRDVDEEILGPEVPYLNAGYMSDPHNGRSQTGYVFTSGGTAISWRLVKQTIMATSSNHAEILAIHEASRESCIAQLKEGYIKNDRTKHILPKFFFTHDLQKSGDIIFQHVRSNDNLADLFTKAPPTSTFRKLRHNIGMHQLKDLK